MTKFINQDLYVSVNSVNLSNHAFKVDINLTKDQVDVSGFNSTGTKEFLPGSKDEEVTIGFLQDFSSTAGSNVDATLWPLYNSGTSFVISVNPTSATASATNPTYSGTANLYEYHPLNGSYGDRSETDVTFKFTGGVTRATA